MGSPRIKLDGTRGLSKKDWEALESLQLFLEDHKITDIDVEPKGQGEGFTIKASNKRSETKFHSWGKTIRDAVSNLVRSVLR